MTKIEIQPVGVDVNNPTGFDLVGVDEKGKRYFFGYSHTEDQAKTWRNSMLEFTNQAILDFIKKEVSQ